MEAHNHIVQDAMDGASSASTPRARHRYSLFPSTPNSKENTPPPARAQVKAPRSPIVAGTTNAEFIRFLQESRVGHKSPTAQSPAPPASPPFSSSSSSSSSSPPSKQAAEARSSTGSDTADPHFVALEHDSSVEHKAPVAALDPSASNPSWPTLVPTEASEKKGWKKHVGGAWHWLFYT